MADEGDAAGGSVLVAEVLRQRAVRERARWEEFNRRKREQEEAVERGRARLVPPSRPTAEAEARNDDDDDGDGTTARADARSEQRHDAREHEEEEEDPMCRICFSGEEDGAKGADRLFSPCQCRGSQGLVHVRCLNHWRARSRNNASYFTCNTCHYRYNLERATWAKRIEDPRLLAAVSLFIVSVIVAATGVAVTFVASRVLAPAFANLAVFCRTRGIRSGALTYVEHLGNPRPSHHWRSAVTEAYQIPNVDSKSPELRAALREAHMSVTRAVALVDTSPVHLEFAFYQVVEWLPPWWSVGGLSGWRDHFRTISVEQLVGEVSDGTRWWSLRHCSRGTADAMDCIVAGLVLLGFAAFGWNVGMRLRGNFRFNLEHLLLPIAMMVSSHGARTARLIVPLGVVYGYYRVYGAVRVWSKELLTRFGERVLEVRPRGAS
jgi:hypothetical protein